MQHHTKLSPRDAYFAFSQLSAATSHPACPQGRGWTCPGALLPILLPGFATGWVGRCGAGCQGGTPGQDAQPHGCSPSSSSNSPCPCSVPLPGCWQLVTGLLLPASLGPRVCYSPRLVPGSCNGPSSQRPRTGNEVSVGGYLLYIYIHTYMYRERVASSLILCMINRYFWHLRALEEIG